MSDREHRDSDVAWLLAREKGQPGPSISEQSAARYERLEALIGELQDTPPQPAGWHERMLTKLQDAASRDATDSGPETAASAPATGRRTTRRRWPVLAGAAALVAAAVITVFIFIPPAPPDPKIAVSVEPRGSKLSEPRGSNPVAEHNVGDILVVRAVVGDSGGELRVYDDAGIARASCKVSGPGCRIDSSDRGTTLVLTMTVERAGTLQAFLFAPALGTPPADLDTDLRAAMQAQHSIRREKPLSFH